MHHRQLKGMVDKLAEAKLIEDDQKELAVKILGKYWEGRRMVEEEENSK